MFLEEDQHDLSLYVVFTKNRTFSIKISKLFMKEESECMLIYRFFSLVVGVILMNIFILILETSNLCEII